MCWSEGYMYNQDKNLLMSSENNELGGGDANEMLLIFLQVPRMRQTVLRK